jgi:organic hydroperoxide reductase OsmC/OhrA
MIMADKLLFTGTTHVVGGADGYARSSDGALDLALPDPHPAAERLFAAAWSALPACPKWTLRSTFCKATAVSSSAPS